MSKDVDELYNTFWKELVENPDGSLNLQAVKNELFDYHGLMEEASKVYHDVTGGNISKPNTAAVHVIAYADERWNAAYEDGYEDAKKEQTNATE